MYCTAADFVEVKHLVWRDSYLTLTFSIVLLVQHNVRSASTSCRNKGSLIKWINSDALTCEMRVPSQTPSTWFYSAEWMLEIRIYSNTLGFQFITTQKAHENSHTCLLEALTDLKECKAISCPSTTGVGFGLKKHLARPLDESAITPHLVIQLTSRFSRLEVCR